MKYLTETQEASLRAMFAPMNPQELDETMDLLVDELYERVRKGTETNMPDEQSNVRNLGWANGWRETPPILEICRMLGHERNDIDHSGMRGTHHEVRCEICRFKYYYDSSG